MNLTAHLVLAALFAADQPGAERPPGPYMVTEASWNKIEVGDPLFLKVTVPNGGNGDLSFHDEFSRNTGLIRIDIRNGEGWNEVVPTEATRKAPPRPFSLRSRESICAYATVHLKKPGWTNEILVFSSPGKHELRARCLSSEGNIISNVVAIEVILATEKKIAFIRNNGWWLPSAMTISSQSAELAKNRPFFVDDAPAGIIRTYIDRNRSFVQWQEAEPGSTEEREAWQRFSAILKELDPVMKEEYLLGLATHYYVRKQFKAALDCLDQLPNPSQRSISLHKMIAERMK